jgi:hypothetical protein
MIITQIELWFLNKENFGKNINSSQDKNNELDII